MHKLQIASSYRVSTEAVNYHRYAQLASVLNKKELGANHKFD